MFFDKQPSSEKEDYELLLRIIASLSKLSTDRPSVPYLYYRMAENIFCKAFSATNLSRSDISVDASKKDFGIGLKTFLHKNGCCLEKIAEFNKERHLYSSLINNPLEMVREISRLRNIRILSTCGISSLSENKLIYHCVTRANSILYLHEEKMNLIDIDNIDFKQKKENTLFFTDGKEEYSFNISKSTLFKRFNINPIHKIPVTIFDDPFELLKKYLAGEFQQDTSNRIVDTICLPLYSYGRDKRKFVPEHSGLNQWNANGRPRDPNEVYIPIPAIIREIKPNFFPSRDESFTLALPNGSCKMAKVCQDDGKALMTNPNEDLGKWILRDVLNLQEGELVTYEKLEEIGIDSVQINKFEDNTYEINFRELGTFEKYIQAENIE